VANPKHVNHQLGPMACPVGLDTVDLFGAGAPEHWYEAYEILHREAPVLRISGGGLRPGTDAFVLTKHADVSLVVKDPERFPAITQTRVGAYAERGMSAEQALDRLIAGHERYLRGEPRFNTMRREELSELAKGAAAVRDDPRMPRFSRPARGGRRCRPGRALRHPRRRQRAFAGGGRRRAGCRIGG